MLTLANIKELEIEMSTLCNAKCPLCYRNYISFKTSPYNKLIIRPFTEVINQLDDFISLQYVMLVGSMSEPTLYPHFIDIIKYLKNRKIKIEICTNGDTHNDIFWKTLSSLLDKNDAVYFTICGSTQELHEKYRRGTILSNILHNASVFRDASKQNDYAQCIRFNYNSNNFDTKEFKSIVNSFSHIYMTETFYPKHISNYASKFNINDFLPNKYKIKEYVKIKKIAEAFKQTINTIHAQCQSIEFNRLQIDVFGNLYPCYLFLESSNGKQWNKQYSSIINLHYDCCKFCSSVIKKYCKSHNLEYII